VELHVLLDVVAVLLIHEGVSGVLLKRVVVLDVVDFELNLAAHVVFCHVKLVQVHLAVQVYLVFVVQLLHFHFHVRHREMHSNHVLDLVPFQEFFKHGHLLLAEEILFVAQINCKCQ